MGLEGTRAPAKRPTRSTPVRTCRSGQMHTIDLLTHLSMHINAADPSVMLAGPKGRAVGESGELGTR
eukprot:6261304-Pyramimonas_sp.AAC.1